MLKTIVIPERARNVVIAVAVAAAAAMLTAFYVSNYKQRVRQEQENVPVLVATKRIHAGTTGSDAIKKGLATVQELPRRSVVAGSFSDPGQVERLVAADDVYPGEQVTARRFVAAQERGIRGKLDGNLRAVELPGTGAQLLSGTLKPGDRVDVVANFKVRVLGEDTAFTRVILRDILVLKAGGGGGLDANVDVDSSTEETSAQLALTDAQAQKLFFAMKNGEWTLDVRPVNDATDSPESIESIHTMLTDGLRPAQQAKVVLGGE